MIRRFTTGTNVCVDLAVGQQIRTFRRQQEMVDPYPIVPVIGTALKIPERVVSGPLRAGAESVREA